MKNIYLVFGLAILLGAAGCLSDESSVAETTTRGTVPAESLEPDVTLTNTYWRLVELNGVAVESSEGRELHMVLRGEDQVVGHAGCNQFTGSATLSGDGLSFGPIASTRRMCAEAMQQENAFLEALENAQRYSISGETLTIENAGGEITMRFVAVYMR